MSGGTTIETNGIIVHSNDTIGTSTSLVEVLEEYLRLNSQGIIFNLDDGYSYFKYETNTGLSFADTRISLRLSNSGALDINSDLGYTVLSNRSSGTWGQDELALGSNVDLRKTSDHYIRLTDSGNIEFKAPGTITFDPALLNIYGTSTVSGVSELEFDTVTGFIVSGVSPTRAKISLDSHFKTIKVPGQPDVVAKGVDTLTITPGGGLTITTQPTDPKTLIFTVSGGGGAGVTGIQGDTGIAGTGGVTGVQGVTGVGTFGTTGLSGVTGIAGTEGTTGIQGITGIGGGGSAGPDFTSSQAFRFAASGAAIENAQFIISGSGIYTPGKLTVDGLIDPTGLQLTPQGNNPGDPNTIWITSGGRTKYGLKPLSRDGFVSVGTGGDYSTIPDAISGGETKLQLLPQTHIVSGTIIIPANTQNIWLGDNATVRYTASGGAMGELIYMTYTASLEIVGGTYEMLNASGSVVLYDTTYDPSSSLEDIQFVAKYATLRAPAGNRTYIVRIDYDDQIDIIADFYYCTLDCGYLDDSDNIIGGITSNVFGFNTSKVREEQVIYHQVFIPKGPPGSTYFTTTATVGYDPVRPIAHSQGHGEMIGCQVNAGTLTHIQGGIYGDEFRYAHRDNIIKCGLGFVSNAENTAVFSYINDETALSEFSGTIDDGLWAFGGQAFDSYRPGRLSNVNFQMEIDNSAWAVGSGTVWALAIQDGLNSTNNWVVDGCTFLFEDTEDVLNMGISINDAAFNSCVFYNPSGVSTLYLNISSDDLIEFRDCRFRIIDRYELYRPVGFYSCAFQGGFTNGTAIDPAFETFPGNSGSRKASTISHCYFNTLSPVPSDTYIELRNTAFNNNVFDGNWTGLNKILFTYSDLADNESFQTPTIINNVFPAGPTIEFEWPTGRPTEALVQFTGNTLFDDFDGESMQYMHVADCKIGGNFTWSYLFNNAYGSGAFHMSNSVIYGNVSINVGQESFDDYPGEIGLSDLTVYGDVTVEARTIKVNDCYLRGSHGSDLTGSVGKFGWIMLNNNSLTGSLSVSPFESPVADTRGSIIGNQVIGNATIDIGKGIFSNNAVSGTRTITGGIVSGINFST